MANFYLSPPPTSTSDQMDHDARITAVITDLVSQEHPNVSATARKYNVARRTLAHRFKGETGPNREATSYSRKQLTDT
jgi:AraC-like DNA-binding protein